MGSSYVPEKDILYCQDARRMSIETLQTINYIIANLMPLYQVFTPLIAAFRRINDYSP
jgi:hypothetical protein